MDVDTGLLVETMVQIVAVAGDTAAVRSIVGGMATSLGLGRALERAIVREFYPELFWGPDGSDDAIVVPAESAPESQAKQDTSRNHEPVTIIAEPYRLGGVGRPAAGLRPPPGTMTLDVAEEKQGHAVTFTTLGGAVPNMQPAREPESNDEPVTTETQTSDELPMAHYEGTCEACLFHISGTCRNDNSPYANQTTGMAATCPNGVFKKWAQIDEPGDPDTGDVPAQRPFEVGQRCRCPECNRTAQVQVRYEHTVKLRPHRKAKGLACPANQRTFSCEQLEEA